MHFDGRKEVWLPLENLVVLVCGIALGRTSLDTLINPFTALCSALTLNFISLNLICFPSYFTICTKSFLNTTESCFATQLSRFATITARMHTAELLISTFYTLMSNTPYCVVQYGLCCMKLYKINLPLCTLLFLCFSGEGKFLKRGKSYIH